MASQIGTAYVHIVPSAKGIQSSTEKVLNGQMTGAGKAAGASLGLSLAGNMKRVLGGAAIGAALKKSITSGAALEQSIGGVETLFKENAAEVIANADSAWRTAGISANDYMEQATSYSASLLQSLNGDTKKAAEYTQMAIVDMSDNANKMGTDLGMLKNAYQGFSKGNFMMLDNLKLGYGGTRGEMERLLEDAGKLSGQTYSIDSLADMYDAIHVIQTELDITGTTAKEAETTLSGSFGAMNAAFTNLMGDLALGRNVSDAFSGLIKSIGTFALNLVPAIGNVIKGIPEALASIDWTSVSGALLDQTSVWVDAGVEWLGELGNGISEGMPGFVAKIPQFVSNIADIINNNAPKLLVAGAKLVGQIALGIIKSIPTIIKSLPQIFVAAIKVWGAMSWGNLGKMAITKIKNGIVTAAGGVRSYIANVAHNWMTSLTRPFVTARTMISNIIGRIKKLFPLSVGKIMNLKIPHFKISGGESPYGLGGKGKKPEISIKWAAKGGIVDGATLIGAGEAGAEGIVPLDPFWNKLDQTLQRMENGGSGNVTVIMELDGKVIGKSTVDYINNQTLRFGSSPI